MISVSGGDIEMENVVKQIAAKSASLPVDLQHEVLDFVEFVSDKSRRRSAGRPFQSDLGILGHDVPNLEEDLAEVRAEMWRKFPRSETE